MGKINISLAKELAKEITESLFYFTKIILGYNELREKVHLKLCEFLNDRYIENDDRVKPNKLILMPRGSFKSTIISIAFVIQSIILNPDIRILLASESYTNSKFYLGLIKNHFESNEKLKLIYGDFVSKFGWREDFITVSKRKTPKKEPTVSCSGVEVTRTGMHYDLIVIDDIVSPNNITTKEQMDKVINFYRECTNLIERTGRKGKIVIVGTRWHFNDLYNHILENEKDNFNTFIRSAYNPDGSLFFPEVLSEEELNRQRKSLGSYLFSANYLNDPISSENAVFKKEWIRYYTIGSGGTLRPEGSIRPEDKDAKLEYFTIKDCNTYLHIDPALSEKKYGDYTGIVVTAISPNDIVYVLYAKRERLNLNQIIDRIFRLYFKYNCKKLLLETQVFQRYLKYALFEEEKKRRKYLVKEEIQHAWYISKEQRISGLQSRFEFGTILLGRDMLDLEDEIIRFPVGQHDDILDALSFGLKYWRRPTTRRTEETPVGSFNWIKKKILNANADLKYIGNQKLDEWSIRYGNWK